MLINIIKWIQKDFWCIIILLVAILLMVYTLYNIKDVEQRVEAKWLEKFNNECPSYIEEVDPIFDPGESLDYIKGLE